MDEQLRRAGLPPWATLTGSGWGTNRVASIGNGYGKGLGIGAGPVTRVSVTITSSGEAGSESMIEMIEARTDLRSGASGGAMVNTAGEVMGVNTANGIVPGTRAPNGYGYAIPHQQRAESGQRTHGGQIAGGRRCCPDRVRTTG